MRTFGWKFALVLALLLPVSSIHAQARLSPGQLDQVVLRIALYPDPLLAQTLTASTYWEQLPEAARWSDEHGYLSGERLAAAISEDHLPWDPSVLALLPFPSVLDLMTGDPSWTQQLGEAVLSQREDVMDAVQHMREKARSLGYLADCPQYRVVVPSAGIVEIVPFDPAFLYVPIYDPLVVFAQPRTHFSVGLSFGSRISIGAAFAPYGWRHPGFGWTSHAIMLDDHPWLRTRENRATYVHPYAIPRPQAGPREEHHRLQPSRRPHRPR